MRAVRALIESLWALDRATPADITRVTGVALEKYEDKGGNQRYRGAHALGTLECFYRPETGACHVSFAPNAPLDDDGQLMLTFGASGSIDINPNIPPEGTIDQTFYRAKDKIAMRWSFTASSHRLRAASVSWTPNKPPTWIYLSSYDRVDQQLQYAPNSTQCRIVPTEPGRALTLGAFVFEYKRHVGVYASPTGPVFFMDATRIDGAFGEIEIVADGKTFRVAKGRYTFEIPYTPRIGLHTNPYDREQSDIDLFALMAERVGDRKWWDAYTKPWVDP